MSNCRSNIHLGVYGIFIKDTNILMIKKNRGPYAGKLDLPGGSIEFKENYIKALKRELLEEVSAKIKKSKFFSNEEYICKYTKNGELKEFHHVGLYFIVDLEIKQLKTVSDGHDSDGALFIPLKKLSQYKIAPIAYKAIHKLIK